MNRKRTATIFVAIMAVVTVFAWPMVARWKENARRSAVMTPYSVPQSERALRVPSPQALSAAFPKGTQQVLEQSSQLTLYSLEGRGGFYSGPDTFQKYKVLGKITYAEPKAKAALLASLYDGLTPDPTYPRIAVGCFSPHHGLRAVHKGKTVDLLICFTCSKFQVFQNNEPMIGYPPISKTPEAAFNKLLEAANVPFSENYKQ